MAQLFPYQHHVSLLRFRRLLAAPLGGGGSAAAAKVCKAASTSAPVGLIWPQWSVFVSKGPKTVCGLVWSYLHCSCRPAIPRIIWYISLSFEMIWYHWIVDIKLYALGGETANQFKCSKFKSKPYDKYCNCSLSALFALDDQGCDWYEHSTWTPTHLSKHLSRSDVCEFHPTLKTKTVWDHYLQHGIPNMITYERQCGYVCPVKRQWYIFKWTIKDQQRTT